MKAQWVSDRAKLRDTADMIQIRIRCLGCGAGASTLVWIEPVRQAACNYPREQTKAGYPPPADIYHRPEAGNTAAQRRAQDQVINQLRAQCSCEEKPEGEAV